MDAHGYCEDEIETVWHQLCDQSNEMHVAANIAADALGCHVEHAAERYHKAATCSALLDRVVLSALRVSSLLGKLEALAGISEVHRPRGESKASEVSP